MTVLDGEAIRELDDAIAAHFEWLTERDITIPPTRSFVPVTAYDQRDGAPVGQRVGVDPVPTGVDAPPASQSSEQRRAEMLANLGPFEVLGAIATLNPRPTDKDMALIGAVLSSLQRLCAFRMRAIGLQRARAVFERRRESRATPKGVGTKVVDLSMKAEHVDQLDRSLREFERRSRGVYRSLSAYRVALGRRAVAFRKAGYHPRLLNVARQLLLSRWVEHRMQDLWQDLDLFREEARGTVADDALGYSGEPDAKALRGVLAECKRRVHAARAPYRVVNELFPSSHPDEPPQRPKDRVRKQIARKRK